MALTIEEQHEGSTTRLHLVGELDTTTAPELRPVIENLRRKPPLVLVLRLRDLSYISSAGLRCVFQMKKIMKEIRVQLGGRTRRLPRQDAAPSLRRGLTPRRGPPNRPVTGRDYPSIPSGKKNAAVSPPPRFPFTGSSRMTWV